MAKQILRLMGYREEKLKRVGFKLLLASVVLTASFSTALAQKAAEDSRLQTRQLKSESLERTVPYNVLVPITYGDREYSEKKYPVIYLLHGLTGHYDNWAKMTKIREYSREYGFIIVMPEGNNGWYTNALNVPSDRYEDFLIRDLIPDIERNFRASKERGGRVVAGLSMEGYGALKFGLKYPDRFVLAGSFSGALNAASFDVKALGNGWKALTDSIEAVYGPVGSETRAENDIFKMIEELSPEKIKTLPFIYVDCGTEDFLIGDNRNFAASLLKQKVPHEFRQLPGIHDWNYWDKQVQEFLQLADAFTRDR